MASRCLGNAVAGLLTVKATAAYAGLSADEVTDYAVVKAAILRQYDISEETHCLQLLLLLLLLLRLLLCHNSSLLLQLHSPLLS